MPCTANGAASSGVESEPSGHRRHRPRPARAPRWNATHATAPGTRPFAVVTRSHWPPTEGSTVGAQLMAAEKSRSCTVPWSAAPPPAGALARSVIRRGSFRPSSPASRTGDAVGHAAHRRGEHSSLAAHVREARFYCHVGVGAGRGGAHPQPHQAGEFGPAARFTSGVPAVRFGDDWAGGVQDPPGVASWTPLASAQGS